MGPITSSSSSSKSNNGSSRKPERSDKTSKRRETNSLGYWDVVLDSNKTHRQSNASNTPRPAASQTRSFSKAIPRYCSICQVTYTSLRAFDEHLNQCASENKKTYSCQHCGLSFRKSSNLTKHVRTVHLGEKNYACTEPGCGRMFGQKSNLSSHIRAVHQREKPFECPESGCNRSFSQKSGLKAHIKMVHEGQRPHVCECGASFGQNGDVRVAQFIQLGNLYVIDD